MHQIFMDLLFALIYGVVIWAIHTITKKVVPFIELKLSESKYGWAAEIISNAVRAYEQTVSGHGMGEDKFQLVMEFVNRELSKLGIKLSEEQITVLIEAAVQAMNAEKLIVEDATAAEIIANTVQAMDTKKATSAEEFEPVFYKDDLVNGVELADPEE